MFELVIPTVRGAFTARYSAHGLSELSFPGHATNIRQHTPVPRNLLQQISIWHRLTTKALKSVLASRAPSELPPLDIVTGTTFQRTVWQGMQAVPWGKTTSYAELAHAIGRPKAVRAVGGACGANPIPVFIPCHRVLAANGQLGGFSGGLDWKRALLAAEGWSEI